MSPHNPFWSYILKKFNLNDLKQLCEINGIKFHPVCSEEELSKLPNKSSENYIKMISSSLTDNEIIKFLEQKKYKDAFIEALVEFEDDIRNANIDFQKNLDTIIDIVTANSLDFLVRYYNILKKTRSDFFLGSCYLHYIERYTDEIERYFGGRGEGMFDFFYETLDKDDFLRYLDGLDDLDYFFSYPSKYGDGIREDEISHAIRYGLKSNDKQIYDIAVGLNHKCGNSKNRLNE